MKHALLTGIILMTFSSLIFCQEWVVPADRANRLSTFPFNDENRESGEKIYTVNCMSCHGTPGKGNYIDLVPSPGDPATDKIQRNRDGEIFYKIFSGRGQMPSFRSVLTTNEIWYVVSFIRSFNSTYKQQIMPVITSSAYPGAEIILNIFYKPGDTLITLSALAVKEDQKVPVTDAAVRLFVERTFGTLQIDDEKITGKEGLAVFRIPDDLPGDTAGNVMVSARFADEEIFGSVAKDTVLQAAVKITPVSLVAERAMWNNVRKAPVWVILTYAIGMLLVWGFILLVLLKLRDIYIIGKVTLNDAENEIPGTK
jgi:cytochrome c5